MPFDKSETTEHMANMEPNDSTRVAAPTGVSTMVYLVASIASLVMLAAGSSVIALTLQANGTKIVGALMGRQPSATQVQVAARPRAVVRSLRSASDSGGSLAHSWRSSSLRLTVRGQASASASSKR